MSWLAGFVPYWSEALLVVPHDGPIYLVAALTFRVKTWIERVSRVGDVLHHPRIGLKAAQQIAAAQKNAAVGIADFDGLPAGVAADLREGGPDLTLSDATALFAKLRGKADPAEIALATKAATIAHRALQAAQGGPLNAMIAAAEREARLLGAEEIYLAAAPDLARGARFMRIEGEAAAGKTFALRATVAYKGVWVRLVRAFCEPEIARKSRGAVCASGRAIAVRPRLRRLRFIPGGRLPRGAAARTAAGIAARRRQSAVPRSARLRASYDRRRRPGRAGRCPSPDRRARRSGEPVDRSAVRLGRAKPQARRARVPARTAARAAARR